MRFRILLYPVKRLTLKALSLLVLFVGLGYLWMGLVADHRISVEDQIHNSYCDCGVKCRREACCFRPETDQDVTKIVVERSASRLCMMTSVADHGFPESVSKLKLVHIPKDIQALPRLRNEGSDGGSLVQLSVIQLESSLYFCRLDRPPRSY